MLSSSERAQTEMEKGEETASWMEKRRVESDASVAVTIRVCGMVGSNRWQ
ncbi:hypothetical protein SCE1572_52055 [Sorangium cellulosum So0157-2]|uniref:Uncharacterized protein n=1 Tax=Sorangium cellulosum So0157-2 TaxID=1254432 RepID=S4YBR9_SORCE|nr:hypothetical protein SCE1572_52055 [Sorangium cellulosum So0157-2]